MYSLKKIIICLCFIMFHFSAFAAEKMVTFVCTGNTGRSPMAEALAKDYIQKHHLNIRVQSRGVNVNSKELTPENGTVMVLAERNIDIADHRATQLVKDDIETSTYLLTMTQKHKDRILSEFPEANGKVFMLSEFAVGKNEDLSDPYGEPLEAYRQVEAQLDEFLPLVLRKISLQP